MDSKYELFALFSLLFMYEMGREEREEDQNDVHTNKSRVIFLTFYL